MQSGSAHWNGKVAPYVLLAAVALMGCAWTGRGAPTCARPAPIHGDSGRARWPLLPPTYIVMFHDGVDAAEEANRLAAHHGFRLGYVYESTGGFSAALSARAVAALRCEPSVKFVERDSRKQPG